MKLKRHNKRKTGLAFLDVLNVLMDFVLYMIEKNKRITSLPFSDALNVLVSSATDSQWFSRETSVLDDDEEPEWMDTGWTKLHARVFRLTSLLENVNHISFRDQW
nr:hypothetical protein [Tanacetum cinerariifolium]